MAEAASAADAQKVSRLDRRKARTRQALIDVGARRTSLLAATLFAHDPAGFDVHVPAGLGGDVLGLGRPGEAGEQALLAGARPPGLGPAW